MTLTQMTTLMWYLPVVLGYLYGLRTLRSCGLPPLALHEATVATTLARLLYAAPAWKGFAHASERERIPSFLNKTIRLEYLPQTSSHSGIWLLLRRMAFCLP